MMQQTFERGTSELQKWSATMYDSHARFVGDLAKPAVDLLDPKPGERILDIGCGDGYLMQKIASSGAIMTGVDYSPELVAAAQARGLDVQHGNGEAIDFENTFDGAFSNAALHWMRRADLVAAGVARALKSGGRFVGEFAGARNAFLIRTAVHAALAHRGLDADEVDPWYLPTDSQYRTVLEKAGLRVTHISLFDRPVVIDYPVADWIRTFGSPYLTVLKTEDRAPFLEEVTRDLAPHLLGPDGRWTVDYTRLRFRAEKP
jgi:trans-aconitate methyltransferase